MTEPTLPELEPLDDDDELVELVVEVVPVVLVCVVLLFEAGAAVDVGTVNGGASDVSAVVEPLPQASEAHRQCNPAQKGDGEPPDAGGGHLA